MYHCWRVLSSIWLNLDTNLRARTSNPYAKSEADCCILGARKTFTTDLTRTDRQMDRLESKSWLTITW